MEAGETAAWRSGVTSVQATLMHFRLEGRRAMNRATEQLLGHAGREALIVPQHDEGGLHGSHGCQKIFAVAEHHRRIRKGILHRAHARLFVLHWRPSFDPLDVGIPRDDDEEGAERGGFSQVREVPGMEMIECAERQDASRHRAEMSTTYNRFSSITYNLVSSGST